MRPKIFVDGRFGTTGLLIDDKLSPRRDIELIEISPEKRRDESERRRLLNEADIDILCLPDDAADKAAKMVENGSTAILDASTAHRTAKGWTYGFPELEPGQRAKISGSKRVAVPGCHATGFTALVHPLVRGGIIPAGLHISCCSVSGYSGGGKKLIAKYEEDGRDDSLKSPRFYSLGLEHKHLPEMIAVNGLSEPPVFTPVVGDFRRGMLVTVPLFARDLAKGAGAVDIRDFYADYYCGERFVKVMPFGGEGCLDGGYLDACKCNGTNDIEIFTFGSGGRILLAARFDNLGKGACGQTVQCMNILIGTHEGKGL